MGQATAAKCKAQSKVRSDEQQQQQQQQQQQKADEERKYVQAAEVGGDYGTGRLTISSSACSSLPCSCCKLTVARHETAHPGNDLFTHAIWLDKAWIHVQGDRVRGGRKHVPVRHTPYVVLCKISMTPTRE
ncbi:hypothetical protein K504DRAFT_508353 [Pleomassaria siparia CBS 279.74]|uniref:Uncharacterized protein n=1 Tax=Pleomassaria siparia CBS 279.74 TaxID=1314801 RepID=A0A6G1JSI5_9PLEO|nr:hypothetical protein K504DRAFT_508353 [Pleomassaria siparia CBS 279.74]